MVQWVRLCAPSAGGPVQSLVGELDPTRIPQLRAHMPQLNMPQGRSRMWQLRPGAA